MRFSIIVPIYNKQQFLPECIRSIQEQSFSDFECILVDDGSNDGSGQIAKDISLKDERFFYLFKPNGGVVSARKTGIEYAKGEYIVNIDADDFVKSDFLDCINTEIERNSPDTVCFRYTSLKNGKYHKAGTNQVIGCYEGQALTDVLSGYLFDFTERYINSGSILANICMKAVKRELYAECQCEVDNRIISGEDTIFSFFWCFYTKKVSCLDYYGYIYRQHESSMEHTFTMSCFTNLEFVCTEMMRINTERNGDFRKNINAYKFYRIERYLYLLAQSSKGLKEYLQRIKQVESMSPNLFVIELKKSKIKFSNKVRYFLVKNRAWLLLYLLGRTWYKGKL